jgi:hypothetical protein
MNTAMENIDPHTRTSITTVICFSHHWKSKATSEAFLELKLKQLQDHAEYLGLWLDYNMEVKETIHHEQL